MKEPSLKELQDSIEELCAYRDRISNEVVSAAQKLRMPKKKVESTLYENFEINKINKIILKLEEQLKKSKEI
tara:strand:- start:134 stop:349 length:216 start_codon:yes stop_codon:yes gene_type:complete